MAASSNSTTSPAVTGRHHIPLNVGKVVSLTACTADRLYYTNITLLQMHSKASERE